MKLLSKFGLVFSALISAQHSRQQQFMQISTAITE